MRPGEQKRIISRHNPIEARLISYVGGFETTGALHSSLILARISLLFKLEQRLKYGLPYFRKNPVFLNIIEKH